jgi:hypothetical protein
MISKIKDYYLNNQRRCNEDFIMWTIASFIIGFMSPMMAYIFYGIIALVLTLVLTTLHIPNSIVEVVVFLPFILIHFVPLVIALEFCRRKKLWFSIISMPVFFCLGLSFRWYSHVG